MRRRIKERLIIIGSYFEAIKNDIKNNKGSFSVEFLLILSVIVGVFFVKGILPAKDATLESTESSVESIKKLNDED
ncbi:MAG: hypothetical protein N4A40_13290 [Tissierellales bacterium]|jgi:hypothetical protein|nr:hypothetical protein [Tissierellales bacterium]